MWKSSDIPDDRDEEELQRSLWGEYGFDLLSVRKVFNNQDHSCSKDLKNPTGKARQASKSDCTLMK